jgi:hypothetical protein
MDYAFCEERDVHYAYNTIHTFFNNFGFREAQKQIDDVLFAADSHRMAKQGDPADVLYFMEELKELSAAAFVIYFSGYTRTDAVLEPAESGNPDISALQHFAGHPFATAWECFPRHLTASQYYNPYKAIRKFCKYRVEQQWHKLLKECTEYALRKFPISEMEPHFSMLVVRLRLQQLTEACYLLEVRTNSKKDVAATKTPEADAHDTAL